MYWRDIHIVVNRDTARPGITHQYLPKWYLKIAESLRTVDALENSLILKGLLYSGYLKAGANILSYFVTPALRRSLTKRSRRVSSLYGR